MAAGFLNPANGNRYNNDWRDFRDATWEKYGYSLDIEDYVANRDVWKNIDGVPLGQWDPRWEIDITAVAGATNSNLWKHIPPRDPVTGEEIWPSGDKKVTYANRPKLREDAIGNLVDLAGYSMGPGYWGKTFVLWPADPRAPVDNIGDANYVAGDWRRRFFRKSDGTEFNPAVDDIDNILFTNGTGSMLRNSGYQVKYDAILAWLRTGPQTLPPNLRSGRILYYSSISRGNTQDQRFWEAYIDHVLGITNPADNLAGNEPRGWPEGATPKTNWNIDGFTTGITDSDGNALPSPSVGNPPATADGKDPRPYSNYTTNPTRPRLHLWFGPLSMIDFLASRSPRRLWWSGTTHEAQCWQLKAAVNSALDDIRINHPNDYCGLAYFNTRLTTPRVGTGQDWTNMKNALFYPYDLLGAIKGGDTTTEYWAHTNGNANNSSLPGGHVPNSDGGTDPHSGMAMGFNLLMSGRKGAAKIVVFETDGAPNNTSGWSLSGSGTNTRYSRSGSTDEYPKTGLYDSLGANGLNAEIPRTGISNNSQTSVKMTLGVVQQIAAPYNDGAVSGLSLPNTPARVYGIGFGDLFEGYDGTNDWETRSAPTTIDGETYPPSSGGGATGVFFLRRAAQIGNTVSPVGDQPLPQDFIITGRYQQRINRMRTTLERIMQSGVQVTLIE